MPSSTKSQTNTVSYSVVSTKRNNSGNSNAEKAGFNDTNKMATYFSVDDAYNVSVLEAAKDTSDNLNQAAVNAIQAYITDDDLVASVPVATKNENVDITQLQITGLDYGYYYITTTTGSVVTIDTTHPNATVNDKNTVPTVDKKITDVKENGSNTEKSGGSIRNDGKAAIAEVGSTVSFESVINVGKGAQNYVFMDKMDNTLSLDTNSITVKIKATPDAQAATDLAATDYTLNTDAVTTGDDKDQYTFKVSFDKTLNGDKELTEGKQIVITYNATVNSSALQSIPGKNRAVVSYGNDNRTTYSETEIYNAKLTVTKNFEGENGENLTAGNYLVAGFKLYKTVDGQNYYYKETKDNNSQVTAVTWTNNATQATELKTTKDSNELNFVGLPNGEYTLTETTVPDGYNKAADQSISIKGANDTNAFTHDGPNANLVKTATVNNKKGSLLPSTGGIGTTIFYVAGIVLVIGAAVVLVNRKHKENA